MWSILIACLFFQTVLGKPGFGPTDQDWGHVTVRESAHLFWWLHYTTADVSKYTDKPLIIWLQGGPGSSGTGYGNFAELGPLDLDLQPRNTTWVQYANVLFVDNPAGTGFGYVDDESGYATNNRQIANDFLVFLKAFYNQLPEFKSVPLYIVCESYGGKMTPEIALVVDQANKNGEADIPLKGIGLGDGWVSPIDSFILYAPYLLNLGVVDDDGYKAILDITTKAKEAFDRGDYENALNFWDQIDSEVEIQTNGVDFYNVLKKINSSFYLRRPNPLLRELKEDDDTKLFNIMNNQVKEALNLTQNWKSQNYLVFNFLGVDFMKPVISIVEQVLNETDIKVAVYNGQLDLIVDTPGTVNWIKKLNFKNKDQWEAADRVVFPDEGYYEGYVRRHENFAFYWVNRAGHMVPADNPIAMHQILKDLTNNFEVETI